MANTETAPWQTGAALAFHMLREIASGSFEEMTYEDTYRDRRPQRNVVAAYFAKLRDLQDTRCDMAFAAVLTDYLAMNMHAGEPNIAVTSGRFTQPIASQVQP